MDVGTWVRSLGLKRYEEVAGARLPTTPLPRRATWIGRARGFVVGEPIGAGEAQQDGGVDSAQAARHRRQSATLVLGEIALGGRGPRTFRPRTGCVGIGETLLTLSRLLIDAQAKPGEDDPELWAPSAKSTTGPRAAAPNTATAR